MCFEKMRSIWCFQCVVGIQHVRLKQILSLFRFVLGHGVLHSLHRLFQIQKLFIDRIGVMEGVLLLECLMGILASGCACDDQELYLDLPGMGQQVAGLQGPPYHMPRDIPYVSPSEFFSPHPPAGLPDALASRSVYPTHPFGPYLDPAAYLRPPALPPYAGGLMSYTPPSPMRLRADMAAHGYTHAVRRLQAAVYGDLLIFKSTQLTQS